MVGIMTVEEGVTLGVTLSVTEESVAVTVCVVLDEGRAEEELGSVPTMEEKCKDLEKLECLDEYFVAKTTV